MGTESCQLTSALSDLREARIKRRGRDNSPHVRATCRQTFHGPLQRIVGRHLPLEVEHGVESTVNADKRRYFANSKQSTVNVRASAVS